MRLKPQPLTDTKWCPVCNGKRTDAASIAAHNLRCSAHGERAYPK
jgi:hypothetical protein